MVCANTILFLWAHIVCHGLDLNQNFLMGPLKTLKERLNLIDMSFGLFVVHHNVVGGVRWLERRYSVSRGGVPPNPENMFFAR